MDSVLAIAIMSLPFAVVGCLKGRYVLSIAGRHDRVVWHPGHPCGYPPCSDQFLVGKTVLR